VNCTKCGRETTDLRAGICFDCATLAEDVKYVEELMEQLAINPNIPIQFDTEARRELLDRMRIVASTLRAYAGRKRTSP
jgi:hypothetical protein